METNWDIADDDLEMLLEFDNDVDWHSTPTVGRKQPPSNTLSTSASTAETGSCPKDHNATNPRNSPEQLQDEQSPAIEDGDEFTSIGKGNEETTPRKSLCAVSGGHDSWRSPEQDINEETGDCHEKRSQDAGMHCSTEEEPASLKHGCSRDVPDVRHNEETDGEDEEQDVRLRSGVGRDRGVGIGGFYGSSQETSGRTRKRIRKDGNAGTGWDDPIPLDDLSKGGMDCNEGSVPEDGRSFTASPLLSSQELPPGQEAAEHRHGCHVLDVDLPHSEWDCSLERGTCPPITVLGYKIPGPAGALQNCLTRTGRRTHGLGLIERHFGPDRPSHRPTAAAADMSDFREGPWLAAIDFLNNGNHSSRSTIVTIEATEGHVPQLVAIINAAVRNSFGDLSVTLKDPTGTIGGTIHRKVLTELEDGQLIAPGAVIIVRKVAVFSPTPFAHYLNITVSNVDKIFGKDTVAPKIRGNAVYDRDDSVTTGRDQPILESGSDGMSQIQTAGKAGNQSESIAPSIDISEGQGGADVTHTVDNDEGVQAECPNNKSPGPGKRVRKSPPLMEIVVDALIRG